MTAVLMVAGGGGLALAAYIVLCCVGSATQITATTAEPFTPPEDDGLADEGEAEQ